jgi:hypothetical protein
VLGARDMKRLLVLVLLSLSAAACGHSLEYTAMNKAPRRLERRDPDSVEVFMSQRPERAAVEVGFFEIEQQSPAAGGTPEMIRKLRARAGAVGCDALLISEPHDRVQSYSGMQSGTVHTTGAGYGTQPGFYQGSSTYSANRVRSHRAICLVFSEQDAKPTTTETAPAAPSTDL